MNDRDKSIIEKISSYCREIKQAHEFFDNNKELFISDDGFVYRNSVTMPILQIGKLTKTFLMSSEKSIIVFHGKV